MAQFQEKKFQNQEPEIEISLTTYTRYTWGRQSGRASKITRRTPMGTVICSRMRLWATLVLRNTHPTLSCAATAIWRRPMAKLLSLDGDKLRRFSKAADKEPVKRREYLEFNTYNWRERYRCRFYENIYKICKMAKNKRDEYPINILETNTCIYCQIHVHLVSSQNLFLSFSQQLG